MTPESVQNGSITSSEVELFRRMRRAVERMPNVDWGETLLSCHHLCHALAHIFKGVTPVDGSFGRGMGHSWLVLRNTKDGPIIADMYPVVGAASFLIHAHWITPWAKLYLPRPEALTEARSRDPNFEQHVTWVANRLQVH